MNDLVATPGSPSLQGALSGLRVIGPGMTIASGVQNESWLEGIAGGASMATDIASFIIDPIASMAASAASFLMEYITPLREALDAIAGNPGAVAAQAQTWSNVSGRVSDTTASYSSRVESALTGWEGPAASAYRTFVASYTSLVAGTGTLCTGIGYAMSGASAVVSFIRTIVRDTVADLVGKLISWAIQVAATVGVGASWVVPKAVVTIAQYVEKVRGWITNLTKSIRNLSECVSTLNKCLDDVLPIIKKLREAMDIPMFSPQSTRALNSGMPNFNDLIPSGVTTGTGAAVEGSNTYQSSRE